MKLYNPMNPKAKLIEVKLNKNETEQVVLAIYKNVNKKGRR